MSTSLEMDPIALYRLERDRRAERKSPALAEAKAAFDADRRLSVKERKQIAIKAALARVVKVRQERPLTELQRICAKIDDAALSEMASGRWSRCL